MDYETIVVEREGGVATVWLNRPERLNAFNRTMTVELHRAFGELDREDSVRAIVVTGKGRAFSAGADLERGGETFSRRPAANPDEPRPWELSTPIIAAMNGAAVGMGLTLPLQWDVRLMAEDARYGFVFTRRGIMPEANSLWLLPRLVGLSRAMELLLSGRFFTGREAAEIGIASRALPSDQVLPAALELAHDIARNAAPVSVALTKRLAYRMLGEPDRDRARLVESRAFWWLGAQPDAAEGVVSFLERREPSWRMSKTRDLPPEELLEPTL
jgi:enoyl-CoA hydratase/carnithine racemase